MNMLAWNSLASPEHPSSSHKSLWILEFLGTSQDQIQIMPRPVKFNTIITQNNLQSQQQSEISANATEQQHKFQDRVIWKSLNILVFITLISNQFLQLRYFY